MIYKVTIWHISRSDVYEHYIQGKDLIEIIEKAKKIIATDYTVTYNRIKLMEFITDNIE